VTGQLICHRCNQPVAACSCAPDPYAPDLINLAGPMFPDIRPYLGPDRRIEEIRAIVDGCDHGLPGEQFGLCMGCWYDLKDVLK